MPTILLSDVGPRPFRDYATDTVEQLFQYLLANKHRTEGEQALLRALMVEREVRRLIIIGSTTRRMIVV